MPEATVTSESERARIVTDERTRAQTISELARQHDLGDEFVRTHVDSGADVQAVRSAALDILASRGDDMPIGRRMSTEGGVRTMDDFREAVTDALLQRAGVAVDKPHPGARDVATMSVAEIARTCLSRAGHRVHSQENTPLRVMERAMSSSDFPMILEHVVAKSLRKGFEEDLGSIGRWTKRTFANDFKPVTRAVLSTAPDIEHVAELGEYKFGSFDEDKEGYSIEKFGKLVRISWEALVNDDLGAFTTIPQAIGTAARRKEVDLVFANVLLANALAGQTMRDTNPLFHVSHANIATGTTLLAALDDGRLKMRRQLSLGGAHLNLAPRFLIVPPERESEAERLLAAAARVTKTGTGSSVESEAKWTSSLELITEARLTNADTVYLSASPAVIDTVEVANLVGAPVPQVMREDAFTVDAVTWKVRHTIGARAIDYRGLVRVDIDD